MNFVPYLKPTHKSWLSQKILNGGSVRVKIISPLSTDVFSEKKKAQEQLKASIVRVF
jgi:hypothetical protein